MITTSQRFNIDQLQLPPGASFSWVGAACESAGEKTLTPQGTDDATLRAAIDAAAAVFIDYDARRATLIANAKAALAGNAAYLGLAQPTQAQAIAQVAALTRQIDALIRIVGGDLSGTT